ncbi:MAG: hypothetical protein DMG22_03405 [Acidobacteria bacterium]|nr:MAG: hypothetical protein DMG22_03405 [Acidobacteriota bacterium]
MKRPIEVDLKRLSFFGAGFAILALSVYTSLAPRASEQEPSPAQNRPAWLHETPIILVSNHDSMPIFRRRVGGNPTWQEEDYEKEHTEEAIRKLKDLGVTVVIVHFYKGFGLEAEHEHIQKAKALAALVKKYGMRLGVYVGSTIAYETFLAEKPEAEEWFVPDFMGRPVFYDDQPFRKRVYFMHPGYREYIQRVLRIAEEDFKADLIHFDNTSMQAEPSIFQHPLAVEQFRDFLKNKYSPEDLKRRLGFSDLRFVLPPRYDRPMSFILDPLFQEWADFRCVQLSAYYAEMENLLRGLNPQVAVETNPHSGISGRNTVWEQGVDYPRLLAHLDAVWTEEGDPAGVTRDGTLVSRIRTFNRNFEQYRDIENIAEVASLHSYASLGFNNDRAAVSTMLFEQAMIQGRVPFDIIFDENLKDLRKYRVLVLADQECLNDEKLDLIRKFVENGGGLVVTEHSTLYTEWRQRRRNFGLTDLLKVDAPHWNGAQTPEEILKLAPMRRQVGQGRVVYISEVKPAIPKPPAVRMTSQYWKLPVNWRELIDAIRWAADDRLSLQVAAGRTVVTELAEQKEKNKQIVHLLNYDVARRPSLQNIVVHLRIPEGKKVVKVTLISPDEKYEDNTLSLDYLPRDHGISFTVPRLRTYSLAIVQLQEAAK